MIDVHRTFLRPVVTREEFAMPEMPETLELPTLEALSIAEIHSVAYVIGRIGDQDYQSRVNAEIRLGVASGYRIVDVKVALDAPTIVTTLVCELREESESE